MRGGEGARSSLVVGTRGSPLALWQAEWVQQKLREIAPQLSVELQRIKTSGDKILDVPLAKVGGKGLFVKEIEEALLRGEIDLAVHSMKDVPTALPDGLGILCIPPRENPQDVLVARSPGVSAGPTRLAITREHGHARKHHAGKIARVGKLQIRSVPESLP